MTSSVNHRLVSFALLGGLAAALSGCASTTKIQTEPPQAEIIMDGTIKLGQSPIEIKEMVWVWTNHQFQARKEGYRTEIFQLRKEYPVGQNLVVCFCTGGLMWPVLLASKYAPVTQIVLTEKKGASVEPVVEAPAVAFDTSR